MLTYIYFEVKVKFVSHCLIIWKYDTNPSNSFEI